MVEVPAFAQFYRAVHGRQPFPWQERLAEEVDESGWPSAVGVPTGLGKTACIDIAVWALAAQAMRSPAERTAPTRIWYVVNRRLLVDAAVDHAERLARLLAAPEQIDTLRPPSGARTNGTDRDGEVRGSADRDSDVAALAAVAAALRGTAQLGSSQGPLHVTRLRGGADLGARVPDPSQPAVITATVPMFASRWLFRGYGSSRSMRPVDAAHAGIDALVLLDEAHLARPLSALAAPAGPLAACDPGDPGLLLRHGRERPQLVALTATGEATGARFDLDERDLAHPVVRLRLHAAKPVTLVEVKDVAAEMAGRAVALVGEAGRKVSCVVFANTTRTARETCAAIRGKLSDDDADIVLLTGRSRDREAEAAVRVVTDLRTGAPSRRPRDLPRDKHLVVVATQTLEVGADLDFDLLVTETASVRALVQRLGRLNRLGERDDVAQAVICHPAKPRPGGLYGDEPAVVWARLQAALARCDAGGEPLSLSPARVDHVLGEPADVPGTVGELLPHHVWEWAKTSVPPVGEAPGRLFYEALDNGAAGVSVTWRAYVPDSGHRLVPPLRAAEAVDIPVRELIEALSSGGTATVCRLRPDRSTVEHVPPERLVPGDQVVLPVDAGLYDRDGWNPASTERALDVAAVEAGTLVLSAGAIAGLMGSPVVPDLADLVRAATALPRDDEDDDEWATRHRDALAALLDRLAEGPHHPSRQAAEWDEFIERLSRVVEAGGTASSLGPALDPPRATDDSADDDSAAEGTMPARLVLQAGRPARHAPQSAVRVDAFDELSFGSEAASPVLADHLRAVGEAAEHIALRLGLPADIVAAVRQAAEYHDAGKADPRFQRWLAPGGGTSVLLAKSSMALHRREAARVAAGWPRGGRHELLSARLIAEGLPTDHRHRDLIVHLVASHHGHGRPTVPVVRDDAPAKVDHEVEGGPVKVSGDLSIPDWSQPARFRRLCERYGYWGLALLEAVVRQADHAVSAAARSRGTRPEPQEVR